jgi:hypothetical protein
MANFCRQIALCRELQRALMAKVCRESYLTLGEHYCNRIKKEKTAPLRAPPPPPPTTGRRHHHRRLATVVLRCGPPPLPLPRTGRTNTTTPRLEEKVAGAEEGASRRGCRIPHDGAPRQDRSSTTTTAAAAWKNKEGDERGRERGEERRERGLPGRQHRHCHRRLQATTSTTGSLGTTTLARSVGGVDKEVAGWR